MYMHRLVIAALPVNIKYWKLSEGLNIGSAVHMVRSWWASAWYR